MASSEDKSLDIFGKPLEITEQERAVLGDDAARVFLRRALSVETHTKKGTVSDPKTLVVSSSRCHIIAQKPSVKLETSFNFLKITLIECSEKKLVFHLSGENRPREFVTDRKNGVTIVGLILAQLKNLFPVTPLDTLIKVSYSTESINSEVSLLHESLRQAMESSDPNSLESFITIYGFLCDLHSIPYIAEISSYLRAAYWTHGFRELNLRDFEHFSIRDLLPLVATLRHNNYFDSFSVDGMRVSVEVFEELAHALVHSQTLKKLKLTNCSLKPDVLFQYCVAWKTNSKSVLSHIDLSKNQLDEKFIESFCTGLESLQHGLQTLKLSNCRISTKVGSLIANAMKQNQDLLYSLTHFDLSENPLGPDSQGPLVFLKEPQTVTTLNLSKCGLNFELVFPILLRGCQQHLRDLDLSQNRINAKKLNVTSLGQIMQQFFSSAISLQVINLSDCKLTPDLAIAIMEGLSVNPNISDTTLNLSSNDTLGHGLDVRSMSDSLSRLKKVNTLNISNTNIDQHLSRLIEALGLNRSIKHLSIGQNFEGREKIEGVKQLCRMIKADDCCLETLDISDSKLKDVTSAILNSLIYNDSIVKLDISGNGMGAHGLRAMVKLLLSGTQLKELHCGNNDITAPGLTYIADAVEHNYTILSISCPLSDIVKVAAKDGDIIEEALTRIQRYLCRNHSDEKLEMKLAKIRQKTLLATSQQSALISREVVQVEQMLSNLSRAEKKPTNYDTEVDRAKAVKEEANKVLQLVDSLYSPQKESQQFEIIVKRMSEVLEREVEGLYREFVQENIETMVTQSVKSCPLLLTESERETLRQIGRRELQSELQETKKAVARRTAPEIINRISGMNLETAAVISELIVDRTLDELEGCTGRLHSMSERIAGSPSKRVSKIFSFRTKDQTTPVGKRRRRKDDIEDDDDEIVLPSDPLTTDGPTLQHLGNKRPRPPRRNQNRPAGLKKAAETGPSSIWDPVPASDDTDNSSAMETKKETDKPVQQAILPKVKSSQDKDTPPPKTPTTPSAKDEVPDTVPLPVKSDESTPSSPSEGKTEERKLTESSKKKSGITKFFGSRKEKDKTPPPTSPTPSSTGTATPTSTTAASPTHSNDSGDKIKENGSKEGGEEKGDGETGTVDIKKASEIVSDEYIVVPKTKQPPPTVKAKPQKSSADSESDTTSAPSGGWKPPGRAGDSVGQLANVLMQGGGIPLLKPTKNKNDKEKEEKKDDDGSAEKHDGPPRSPPPVKNKPKRPSGKGPANDAKESTSKNENDDGAAEKEENDEESIEL